MSQSNSRSSPAADVNMDVMVTDSLPVVPAPVVSVPVVSAPALSAPVVVDASSLRNDVNSLRMELVILGSQYYRRADDQVLADLQLQIDSKTRDLQVLSKMLVVLVLLVLVLVLVLLGLLVLVLVLVLFLFLAPRISLRFSG